MQSVILNTLTECGYQVRAVPYSHVREIHETIHSLYQAGSLAQGVYDEVMEYVSYDPPKDMPEPKSIIILVDWESPQSEPHIPMERWTGRYLPAGVAQGI